MLMHPDGDDGTHDNGGARYGYLICWRKQPIALEVGYCYGYLRSTVIDCCLLLINQRLFLRIPDGRFLKTLVHAARLARSALLGET